ncbi:hypothetical protein ACFL2V_21205, partial [Pseudomonadota bacterium]
NFAYNIFAFFNIISDVSEEKIKLEDYKLDKKLIEVLGKIVKEQVKPPVACINGDFVIKTYDPNGAEVIRHAFEDLKKEVKGDYIIKYMGGSKYSLEIKGENYQVCEDYLSKITKSLETKFTDSGSEFSFVKKDGKTSA